MLLIGNGALVARDVDNTFYDNGAVCITDNYITEVGPYHILKEKYPEAEFIDAKGGVIMPGLINTHHHIYSAFARGMNIPGNNPQNFLEILEGTWWRLDRGLTLKQSSLSARATYMECIRNGVTTIIDHHASYGHIRGSLAAIAEAAKVSGVRTCLAYEVSDRDGRDKMLEAIKENSEFAAFTKTDNSGRISALMGLHASFTLSDDTLALCREYTHKQSGFHIHVAEGLKDETECRNLYGSSVVKRLLKEGILGEHTIAAHCIHIDEEDMDILKETNTMVVHNPESNMGNAVGAPKVLAMYKKGVLLGLGTDGYTSDMLESLKVANILQKHEAKNPSAAWTEIPEMLYFNNPSIAERVMSSNPNCKAGLGKLIPGAFGDVIIMDYKPITPLTKDNINGHILFGMSGKDTSTVVVNGKVLMKERQLLAEDEEKVLFQCREAAKELWNTI